MHDSIAQNYKIKEKGKMTKENSSTLYFNRGLEGPIPLKRIHLW